MLSNQFIERAIANPLMNQKCSDLHPGSCHMKGLDQLIRGTQSVFRMYLLVHLIPFILFKRKKVMKNPVKQIKKLIFGIIKSLIFAGGSTFLVRRIMCLTTQFYKYHSISALFAPYFTGFLLLFQPQGRQKQIALFCLAKATQTSHIMLKRRGYKVSFPYGQALLMAISLSLITFIYFDSPNAIRESYRKVLDKFLMDI